MKLLLASNSSTSLDEFLKKLPEKIGEPININQDVDSPAVVNSVRDSSQVNSSNWWQSFSELQTTFINDLPLILVTSLLLTAMTFLIWRRYEAKRSKLRYLTTLTSKHYTPEVFKILGKQCHLLAYRTGYGFAVMTLTLVDKKVSRRKHDELAFCLASCLREDDVIADYGNGHFKILLPYLAEVVDYEIVLFRLRSRLIRTSIGVSKIVYSTAVFPDGGSTFNQMLRACSRSFKPL